MKTLIAVLLLTSLCYGQQDDKVLLKRAELNRLIKYCIDTSKQPEHKCKAYKLADAIIASRKAKAYADSICSQVEHVQTSIEILVEKWDKYKAWAKESVKTPTGAMNVGEVVDSIKLYRRLEGDSVNTFLYRFTPDSAFIPRERYPTFDKFIEWLRNNK